MISPPASTPRSSPVTLDSRWVSFNSTQRLIAETQTVIVRYRLAV